MDEIKCNIKFIKLSKFHYKSEHGYFISESGKWFFAPFEKKFSEDVLFDIANSLKYLNSSHCSH